MLAVLPQLSNVIPINTSLIASTEPGPGVVKIRTSVTPFTLAQKGKMPKEVKDECDRAVTKFIVKGLLPFSTVDAPWWR